MARRARPPADRIDELLLAPSRLQAVYVAVRLGIPDMVKDGPRSSTLLASTAGVHPGALHRLMRFLAAEGVFECTEDGRFAATPLSNELTAGASNGYREVLTGAATRAWNVWGNLLYSVETGRPAFDKLHGMSYFEEQARNPGSLDLFDAGLAAGAADAGRALAGRLPPDAKVVDVGCGSGALLAEVLKRLPGSTGVAFDREDVLERARKRLEPFGERAELVTGDFFRSVPSGGSYYVLSLVVHDWDDDEALSILRNCQAAMAPGARLAVLECVMPDDVASQPSSARADIGMLVMTGGRERTQAEYRALFERAGLRFDGATPLKTSRMLTLMLGTKGLL